MMGVDHRKERLAVGRRDTPWGIGFHEETSNRRSPDEARDERLCAAPMRWEVDLRAGHHHRGTRVDVCFLAEKREKS